MFQCIPTDLKLLVPEQTTVDTVAFGRYKRCLRALC